MTEKKLYLSLLTRLDCKSLRVTLRRMVRFLVFSMEMSRCIPIAIYHCNRRINTNSPLASPVGVMFKLGQRSAVQHMYNEILYVGNKIVNMSKKKVLNLKPEDPCHGS